MVALSYPKRGDFIWLEFDPASGHEQQGKRPALVISHTKFNQQAGFAFVCPISTTRRSYPFYVDIPESRKYKIKGKIFCDQLKSLDFKARNFKVAGSCPKHVFESVLKIISAIVY